MPRFNPEQIIDELYGPPVKKGQKKLEDFKKKAIPKPEKPKTLNPEIIARDKEGKEVVFDLEQIRQEWTTFYNENNLPEFAKALENTNINLTKEQVEEIQEKSERGFDRLILFPPIELQQEHFEALLKEMVKEIPSLQEQYSKEVIWLSDTVKPNFPDKTTNKPNKITTNNREKTENKPYLLFLKDTLEVDSETLNKTPEQLRTLFNERNETSLTIAEYLIFQRDYAKRRKTGKNPHPDTGHYTYLLDSELSPDSSWPGQVLGAYWGRGSGRVRVGSSLYDISYSDFGARSSAIFEIL